MLETSYHLKKVIQTIWNPVQFFFSLKAVVFSCVPSSLSITWDLVKCRFSVHFPDPLNLEMEFSNAGEGD